MSMQSAGDQDSSDDEDEDRPEVSLAESNSIDRLTVRRSTPARSTGSTATSTTPKTSDTGPHPNDSDAWLGVSCFILRHIFQISRCLTCFTPRCSEFALSISREEQPGGAVHKQHASLAESLSRAAAPSVFSTRSTLLGASTFASSAAERDAASSESSLSHPSGSWSLPARAADLRASIEVC